MDVMDVETFRKEAQDRLSAFTDICREIITRSISLSDNPKAVPADSTALSRYTGRVNRADIPKIGMLTNYATFLTQHRAKVLDVAKIKEFLDNEASTICWMSRIFNPTPLQIFFSEGKTQFGFIDLTKIFERACAIKTLALQALDANPDNVLVENKYEDIIYLYRLYRVFEISLPDSDPDKAVVTSIVNLIKESTNEDVPTASTATSSTAMPAGFGDFAAILGNISKGDLSGLLSIGKQIGIPESTIETVTSTMKESIAALERNEKPGDIVEASLEKLKSDPGCRRYAEMAMNMKEELSKESAPAPEVTSAVTEMLDNDRQ